MPKKLFILLQSLIVVICFAIPFPCLGQNGSSLSVELNPKPDDNGSMNWWKTWRPSWEATVSFRAELSGAICL